MNAQQKSNDQYTQYCAQYADLGFKIETLVKQRRQVKQQIDALNATVPLILQAELDGKAQAQASQAQESKDPQPEGNHKTADFSRARPAQESRQKN
jgi:hypothetical protein